MNYVLITGASSGIGLDMAKIFAEKRYNLILVSRNENKLETIKTELEKDYNIQVLYYSVDLSESGSVKNVLEFTENNKLDVDILINNAGVGLYGEHVDMDIDEVSNMLQLNIASLSELCFYYGKRMKEKREGKILNIASAAAYQPTPYFAAYGASKSFVLNFSEALAKEMEDYNVTVTCLSPGATDTGFFTEMDKKDLNNPHLDKKSRVSSKKVAEIGVNALFNKKLSVIVGTVNKLRVFSAKFATRNMVANISKSIMKDHKKD